MTMMIAYHGRHDLKDRVLAELARHREADKLVQGYGYWKDGRGCAVGCTLQSLCVAERMACSDVDRSDHSLYERFMGVPEMLARLEDALFEALPPAAAQQWPERFAAAIRPGADLSLVGPRFLHWLLTAPDGGVQAAVRRWSSIEPSVTVVARLYERWLDGSKPNVTEWCEVESVAAAASAFAAEAAFAADAAAAASTYAAARGHERQRQADKLIELLAAC